MSRQKIAAGNWKMHTTLKDGLALANEIAGTSIPNGVEVVLGVPFTHLHAVAEAVKSNQAVSVAAQNCHQALSGAFTGEISVDMLKAIGAKYVILGHSERREIFDESDELLKEKVDTVLAAGLIPLFCCGEPLAIREAGNHIEYVKDQLTKALFHLSEEQFGKLVIAYEPIWAIGTGKTASPEQAQEMQAALRTHLASKFSNANDCPILYGGSVKPNNAKEIFGQTDVDGGLVGGASLSSENFIPIINSFS